MKTMEKKGLLTRVYNIRGSRVTVHMCGDCKTEYHHALNIDTGLFQAKCNGRFIDLCPWCREDSKPWAHGRGV